MLHFSRVRTTAGRRCYGPPVTTVTTNHFPPGCRGARCAAVSHYFHFMSLSRFIFLFRTASPLPPLLADTCIEEGSSLLFLQRKASCRYAVLSMRVAGTIAIALCLNGNRGGHGYRRIPCKYIINDGYAFTTWKDILLQLDLFLREIGVWINSRVINWNCFVHNLGARVNLLIFEDKILENGGVRKDRIKELVEMRERRWEGIR